MTTRQDHLRNTARHAYDLWEVERRCQPTNAVHESAWSLQVVEPILSALGWRRLRRDETTGDGAFFEWPKKHQADVALLRAGTPTAFLELKQTRVGCLKDLRFKLERHPALRVARFGVASWFLGQPGFCSYTIAADATLGAGPVLELSALAEDPRPLAALSAEVLAGAAAAAWLASAAPDEGPVVPRLSPRAVQRRFFSLLGERLGLARPLETRHRCTVWDPPTPSYAFAELPGVLPTGWGLVLDFDTTVNDMQCFFYRNSNTKLGGVGKWNFDKGDGVVDDASLAAFLDQRVLPQIGRWRREAAESGLI